MDRLIDWLVHVINRSSNRRLVNHDVPSILIGISVRDLAGAMNRSLDNVFEAMLYVEGADVYDQPSAPIGNMKILDGIVKRCGFRPEHVQAPAAKAAEILEEIKRESKCDIKPR